MKEVNLQELESGFQAKIDNEIRIEPKDWMPERYRKTLIRQISQYPRTECLKPDELTMSTHYARTWSKRPMASRNISSGFRLALD